MKVKPIAIAAISGLVIALAGMPVMADDNNSTDQSAQSASDKDNADTADSNVGSSDNATNNSDEGSPDTPSGDDF